MAYILNYENAFEVKQTTELKLHNFLTRAIMPDEIQDSLLSVQATGLNLYHTFRKEHLVEKTKRLSDNQQEQCKDICKCRGKDAISPRNVTEAEQEGVRCSTEAVRHCQGPWV